MNKNTNKKPLFDRRGKSGTYAVIMSLILLAVLVIGNTASEVFEGGVGNNNINVVNVASHDTASAVIAVPATEEDFVYISSGTWSLMGKEIPEPLTGDVPFKYEITNESYKKILDELAERRNAKAE